MSWLAYVDESICSINGGFVLAAACLEPADAINARGSMTSLAKSGQRFRWREESEARRRKAVGVVAGLPAMHLVVVGTPVNPHEPERARHQCLRRLVLELNAAKVTRAVLEARDPSGKSRDLQTVEAMRAEKVIGSEITVLHRMSYGSRADPMLWIPDIVAGAVSDELDHGHNHVEQIRTPFIRLDIGLT